MLDRLLSNLDVHVEPFSFCLLSAGWRLNLPPPPCVMLHFVLQGHGSVRGPQGGPLPIGPYWLAVIPPGARHALETGRVLHERQIHPPPEGVPVPPQLVAGSAEASQLIVACGLVRVAYGDSLGVFDRLHDVLTVDLSGNPEVRDAFEGILAEQSRPGPGSEAMQEALMSQCLVQMFRRLGSDPETPLPWLTVIDHPQLSRALDRILESPGAHHTVDSLADVACMSRSTFARRFTDTFGIPPMSLLHEVRMQRAARLLQQCDMPIGAVAHLAGFSSRSHFSRAFKQYHGVAPAEYRASGTRDLSRLGR